MTKVAIRTAWVALFIGGVVLAYGYGFNHGRSAQLGYEDVLKIAKSQFTCRMENKWIKTFFVASVIAYQANVVATPHQES